MTFHRLQVRFRLDDAAGGGVRGQRRALAGDRRRPRAVGADRAAGAARHDLRHVLERGDRAGRRHRPRARCAPPARRCWSCRSTSAARSATRSPAASTTRTARGCCSCWPRSASSRRWPSCSPAAVACATRRGLISSPPVTRTRSRCAAACSSSGSFVAPAARDNSGGRHAPAPPARRAAPATHGGTTGGSGRRRAAPAGGSAGLHVGRAVQRRERLRDRDDDRPSPPAPADLQLQPEVPRRSPAGATVTFSGDFVDPSARAVGAPRSARPEIRSPPRRGHQQVISFSRRPASTPTSAVSTGRPTAAPAWSASSGCNDSST